MAVEKFIGERKRIEWEKEKGLRVEGQERRRETEQMVEERKGRGGEKEGRRRIN